MISFTIPGLVLFWLTAFLIGGMFGVGFMLLKVFK
jgi:hypothetical protein